MTAFSSHDPVHRLAAALVLLAFLGTLLGLAGSLPQSPGTSLQYPVNGYDPSDIIGPSHPRGPDFPDELCQTFFPFSPAGPTLPPCRG